MRDPCLASRRNDLRLYRRDGWWDPSCRAFASLRSVNECRLDLLRGWLAAAGAAGRPGVVIDLGCGGGLMAVPLIADGHRVLGIDLSRPALAAARAAATERGLFATGDLIGSPLASRIADLVLLADVLEHVSDAPAAVAEAARLLRPGGHLFVSTINRTILSRLLGVTLAEGLGLVPRGTHDPAMFVRPQELDRWAATAGLARVARAGEVVRPWATLRDWTIRVRPGGSLALGYSALFRREMA